MPEVELTISGCIEVQLESDIVLHQKVCEVVLGDEVEVIRSVTWRFGSFVLEMKRDHVCKVFTKIDVWCIQM